MPRRTAAGFPTGDAGVISSTARAISSALCAFHCAIAASVTITAHQIAPQRPRSGTGVRASGAAWRHGTSGSGIVARSGSGDELVIVACLRDNANRSETA